MQHYKIKLVDTELRKYKIYVRGIFRYHELDGKVYDVLEDAEDALEKHIGSVHSIIHY